LTRDQLPYLHIKFGKPTQEEFDLMRWFKRWPMPVVLSEEALHMYCMIIEEDEYDLVKSGVIHPLYYDMFPENFRGGALVPAQGQLTIVDAAKTVLLTSSELNLPDECRSSLRDGAIYFGVPQELTAGTNQHNQRAPGNSHQRSECVFSGDGYA